MVVAAAVFVDVCLERGMSEEMYCT